MSLTNEPAWQPDPFGRHELRWWDGTTWTDQVADGGVTSVDPPGASSEPPTAAIGGIPPAPPPGAPIGGSPPGVPLGGSPPGAPPGAPLGAPPGAPPTHAGGGGGGGNVAVIVGIVVVVALIAGAILFFVLGGDDGGGGTGEFSGTLEDDQLDFYEVDLSACEAVRADLENVDGFDATLAIATGDLDEDFFDDEDDIDAAQDQLEGFFSDGDAEDLLADEDLVAALDTADSGFEDEDETVGAVAPYDLTVTVVVGSFDGQGGDYELTIETADPPEGADCDFTDADDYFDFVFSDESDYYSDFLS